GQLLDTVDLREGRVNAVAYSPDGRYLVAGCERQVLVVMEEASWGTEPAVSPDRESSRLKIVAKLEGHSGAVTCLAFEPHGRFLVSGSEDADARLWDLSALDDPQRRLNPFPLEGVPEVVHDAVWQEGTRRFILGDENGVVRAFSAEKSAEGPRVSPGSRYGNGWLKEGFHGAFSPDGRWAVASFQDGTMEVWTLPLPGKAGEDPQATVEARLGPVAQ